MEVYGPPERYQLRDQWNMTASGSMGCAADTSRHLVLFYYHYPDPHHPTDIVGHCITLLTLTHQTSP